MARGALRSGRGFTLVEALVLAGAFGAGAAMLGVMSQPPAAETPNPAKPAQPLSEPPPSSGGQAEPNPGLLFAMARARASARQLKCSTQVRGIAQSMIVWAANNDGKYPLPSEFDAANQTVSEVGRAKDTTANIYSLLIQNGNISCEICVCPDEHAKSIKPYEKYEYTAPSKAVKPADALWDPAFSADFVSGKGRVSYAHLQPSGDFANTGQKGKDGKPVLEPTGRLKMWSDTYDTSEAVVGDRGPEILSVEAAKPDDAGSYKPKTKLAESVTFKNHGDPKTWEGNIAFNDCHVAYLTALGPLSGQSTHFYKTKEGAKRADTIFFDEPDDPAAMNTFLGIFPKAGRTPGEFQSIWD